MLSFLTIASRIFLSACLCLTLILFPLPSYAFNFVLQPTHVYELNLQNIPHPPQSDGKWVIDMAKILDSNTRVNMNQIISDLQQKTGDKIFIVTVTKTRPAPTPQVFATELFNYWEIGKKGVLFLISVEDRRVEIKTGYGIQGIISDVMLREIIQENIIPQFKQGNFSQGIFAGTKSLLTKLDKKPSAKIEALPSSVFIPLVLFALLFIVIVVFCLTFVLSPMKMVDEISDETNKTESILVELSHKRSGGSDGSSDGGSDGSEGGSW